MSGYDATVEDLLRPQTTIGYKKGPSMMPYDFPNMYISGPIAVMDASPMSTRAVVQNSLFKQRYFDK
jgi:hypothetical protein